jgi:hypothetical protein
MVVANLRASCEVVFGLRSAGGSYRGAAEAHAGWFERVEACEEIVIRWHCTSQSTRQVVPLTVYLDSQVVVDEASRCGAMMHALGGLRSKAWAF